MRVGPDWRGLSVGLALWEEIYIYKREVGVATSREKRRDATAKRYSVPSIILLKIIQVYVYFIIPFKFILYSLARLCQSESIQIWFK